MTIPSEFDVQKFLANLDQHPELKGIRVVFVSSGGAIQVIREGPPFCAVGQKAVILREPIEQTAIQSSEAAESRDSKVLSEVLGAGLSCGAAVISWVVVITSASATPVTGGGSAFITALSFTAAGASTVQCVNGIGRVAAEVYMPEELDILDQEVWYQRTSMALDVISLAGAVTAGAVTIRLVLKLKGATGKTVTGILKGLNSKERKRLAEELIRELNPGISNGRLKTLIRKGIYPKRLPKGQVAHALRTQLLDAAGAAMSFTGSATSGVVRNAVLVVGFGDPLETF